MSIATILNTQTYNSVFEDTLDSIRTFCTKDILVMVDGCSWDAFENEDIEASKMCGFRHGIAKPSYRNMALGLSSLYEAFPNKDWYLYCEQDVLFGSSRFIPNLKMASEQDVWMMGFSGHIDEHQLPLIDSMLGEPLKSCYYLAGCCMFFSQKFMQQLQNFNFFDRFLNLTNGFSQGEFPSYSGSNINEHLYPSLCRHFGGNIGVFSTYENDVWHGFHEYYPVRLSPSISEGYQNASILCPSREFDDARSYHLNKRTKFKEQYANMGR